MRACADRLNVTAKYRSLQASVYAISAEVAETYGYDSNQLVIFQDRWHPQTPSVMIVRLPKDIGSAAREAITLPAGHADVFDLSATDYAKLHHGLKKIGKIVVSMATAPAPGAVTGVRRDKGTVLTVDEWKKTYVVVGLGLDPERNHRQLILAPNSVGTRIPARPPTVA